MSFVVKCYNTATGHVETVSDPIKDVADVPATAPDPDWRKDVAAMFARRDTSDSHVYYADTSSA